MNENANYMASFENLLWKKHTHTLSVMEKGKGVRACAHYPLNPNEMD